MTSPAAPDSSPPPARTRRAARPTRAVVLTVLVTLALVALAAYLVVRERDSRRWLTARLEPELGQPPAAALPFGLRAVMADERDRAAARGDLGAASAADAQLAQEALRRAAAVHHAWLARREPETRLYAQNREAPEWNYRNTAADFFAFHLHAGMLLNPGGMPSLRETLDAEAALRTPAGLCQPVLATTGERVDVDHDELIFASSEYAKDGLLSVYERHGGDLVGPRLFAIVDAILKESKHPSKFGPIPGQGAEVNGNLLQLCSRLSYAAGRDDYAEFAARIADAMTQQAMPANGGLPAKFFDYGKNQVVDAVLKLKDHGNEAVLGLSEAYAMAVARRGSDPKWGERADRWAEPVARMYEVILAHGVNRDGLLVTTMDPAPPRPTADELCDNWGYILAGAACFTDAARRDGRLDAARLDAIDARVDAVARASFARPLGLPWGDDADMDSEADAIESGIYVAAFRPALREEALRWADRHVDTLFARQRPDGTAGGRYLDGNFIRTSLLYADTRTGGWRVDPWRADVAVGLARGPGGEAVLTVRCTAPYTGTLRAPEPRHRTVMKLPWNWARLNCWPEWHDLRDGTRVTGSAGLSDGSVTVEQLRAGLPLNLPASAVASVNFAGGPTTTAPAVGAPTTGPAARGGR